ncbi:alpha-1,6-mannosyl-glycoprotein 4-beta-N-acetylglucosaminyltransferase-like [Mya arenaria]|uniref:alpha-1,6-mannosyl-glycoprotein 4-beta-N-acetylglucosaminyltransferase-like n=1 Tax=Mya arenaria TaxID=6604 RepID=UPI0022DF3173|nr:alpha-1,6-mannosyl-glycoprotein 4-beta-N-acetylglucosaminyltransferase-like [Mya arenaria]
MRLWRRQVTLQGLFVLLLLATALQTIHLLQHADKHEWPDLWNWWQSLDASTDGNILKGKLENAGLRLTLSNQPVDLRRNITISLKERGKTVVRVRAPAGEAAPPLLTTGARFLPPEFDPVVAGQARTNKGFLTVGIPSVQRPNTDSLYLLHTVSSLVAATNKEYRKCLTIVVLLVDSNVTYNAHVQDVIEERFREHLNTGFIRVIIPPPAIYPSFKRLASNHHDSRERTIWRSKQNIDFAYLFLYCRNISEYYIQLEDDVLVANNYTFKIKAEINNRNNRNHSWFMLEFSRLGFIGKLFRTSDLEWIANKFLESFDTKPGDLLIGQLRKARGQNTPFHSSESLFQHFGRFSSLAYKMMPSVDAFFSDSKAFNSSLLSVPKGDNPDAAIHTNMKGVRGHDDPYMAYDGNSETYFEAKMFDRANYFQLKFLKAYNFSRLIITSGDLNTRTYHLPHSALYVYTNDRSNHDTFKKLVNLVEGDLDTQAMGITMPKNINSIKIIPIQKSAGHARIRDIEVFT